MSAALGVHIFCVLFTLPHALVLVNCWLTSARSVINIGAWLLTQHIPASRTTNCLKWVRTFQTCIVSSSQMVFKEEDKVAEQCFMSTWNAYKKYCPQIPAESSHFKKPRGNPGDKLEYDFCDRCGIDCNPGRMYFCECCWEGGYQVVIHSSCIDRAELQWLSEKDRFLKEIEDDRLLEEDEEDHHWRCSKCRYLQLP